MTDRHTTTAYTTYACIASRGNKRTVTSVGAVGGSTSNDFVGPQLLALPTYRLHFIIAACYCGYASLFDNSFIIREYRSLQSYTVQRNHIYPILGFWLGEQSSPKWDIPCPRRQWTAVQKFDAVSFILGAEMRNRTNTKLQTSKRTNSKWYIHTLPIGMCGYWINKWSYTLLHGQKCKATANYKHVNSDK